MAAQHTRPLNKDANVRKVQDGSGQDSRRMNAFLQLPIRILTHNIRYATKSPFQGEEFWSVRAPRLINELRYNTMYNQESFMCLQEVLDNQLTDIIAGLNSNKTEAEWAYIGVGRDDGCVRLNDLIAAADSPPHL